MAVHPISALQSEWSLWARDLEAEVAATARRLGVGIVPFSPLGRGFLAGVISSPQSLDSDDSRRRNQRFQDGFFDRNMAVVREVASIANEKGVTAAQLALKWVLARGEDVVPIPGTKRRPYLEENVAALSIELSESDLKRLEEAAPIESWVGSRYPGGSASSGYGDSPKKSS
jgi:aryl-alcohol dehydrogenase-like predicted oxidoreductase